MYRYPIHTYHTAPRTVYSKVHLTMLPLHNLGENGGEFDFQHHHDPRRYPNPLFDFTTAQDGMPNKTGTGQQATPRFEKARLQR
jgi:hypothetical protein